ncbi:MAG: pyridoxal-phosphate dependent enzyme [Planctomycetota bacterium]
MIYPSQTNTPVMKFGLTGKDSMISLKLDYLQYGGSVKSRAARAVMSKAKSCEKCSMSKEFVTWSYGNLAVALAMAAKKEGYTCHMVVPDWLCHDQLAVLRALEMPVVRVSTDSRSPKACLQRVASEVAFERKVVFINQSNTEEAIRAYHSLGEEILAESNEITSLYGTVGIGGSLCGTAERIVDIRRSLNVVATKHEDDTCFELSNHTNWQLVQSVSTYSTRNSYTTALFLHSLFGLRVAFCVAGSFYCAVYNTLNKNLQNEHCVVIAGSSGDLTMEYESKHFELDMETWNMLEKNIANRCQFSNSLPKPASCVGK